jgi:hypothetical protein
MKKIDIHGTHKSGKHTVEVRMPVIEFEEEGVIVLFAPALDISGYGYTEEEAKKSFRTVFEEFIDYTLKKDTLHKELMRLGWELKSVKTKKVKVPTLESLMKKNSSLKELFEGEKPMKVDFPSFPMPLAA